MDSLAITAPNELPGASDIDSCGGLLVVSFVCLLLAEADQRISVPVEVRAEQCFAGDERNIQNLERAEVVVDELVEVGVLAVAKASQRIAPHGTELCLEQQSHDRIGRPRQNHGVSGTIAFANAVNRSVAPHDAGRKPG